MNCLLQSNDLSSSSLRKIKPKDKISVKKLRLESKSIYVEETKPRA